MAEIILVLVLTADSWFFVNQVKSWMQRSNRLDIPNARSSHTTPIPRGGGLAIAVLTLGGWAIYSLIVHLPLLTLLAYLLGAALIAALGWRDDLRSLSPYQRLAGHIVGALLVIVGIGYWQQIDVPLIGQVTVTWLGIVLTLLWLVGLTNAYNFMDGIDGIAGGQAVVAGLGWALLAGDNPTLQSAKILGLLIAGGSLGFLLLNWPPARIFMGDVGSGFLGFTFAVIPLLITQNQPEFAVVGVLLLWPFLFDASLTFLLRLKRRQNVLQPHRSHLYQRLVDAGCSVRFVTLLYITLDLTGVIVAYFWLDSASVCKALILPFITALALGLWFFVRQTEKRLSTRIKPSSAV